jgi:hypothetical protein
MADSIAQVAEGPEAPLVRLGQRALRLAKSGAIGAALLGLVIVRLRR